MKIKTVAQQAAWISLLATIVVVIVKLVAAGITASISVLAEALQSSVDVMMSLLALFSLRVAAQPPDEEHNYGHGKAELLSSAFQMMLILATAGFVLFQCYARLLEPRPIRWDWGALAMGYALVSNTCVGFYLRRVAKKTDSATLESEALHLRADSLSSLGILLGLLAVGLTGWLFLDPAFGAIFTLIAMVQAGLQLQKVLHPLMDGALAPQQRQALEKILSDHPKVRGYHNLKTRAVGSWRQVELHVMLDDDLSFVKAHEIAEQIEDGIRAALGGATVSVHYEPYEAELVHRAKEHPEATSN